ncbi:hypothetical protein H6F75_23400 [Nodosilinea sp. FACHB-131]|nr:hypothetical protein [Nodosilinea sp. FACHB-131]MBD1876440.1 hypothetical protein [Nodosilinea sp. FACHB-131]
MGLFWFLEYRGAAIALHQTQLLHRFASLIRFSPWLAYSTARSMRFIEN